MTRHERLQANNFKTIIFAKFEGIDFSNIPFNMVELRGQSRETMDISIL